jgi:hypothetical protein
MSLLAAASRRLPLVRRRASGAIQLHESLCFLRHGRQLRRGIVFAVASTHLRQPQAWFGSQGTMRFGNRISGRNWDEVNRRRQQYLQHLLRTGFPVRSRVYQLFGSEVFHDSEISALAICPSRGSVEFILCNTHALNKAAKKTAICQSGRHVRRSGFRMAICFEGVEAFHWSGSTGSTYYVQAEIDRRAGELYFEMQYAHRLGIGKCKFTFKSIKIGGRGSIRGHY